MLIAYGGFMWAAYIKETLGKEMIQTDKGFATFFIVPGTSVCYIEDIYVLPEHRKSDITTEMENSVKKWAVERGCTELMGSVNLSISTPERSLQILLHRGYKLSQVTPSMIYLKKKL
jgi:GNAT superfamily N-acetyltransferase